MIPADKLGAEVGQAVVASLRRTRDGLAAALDAERLFLVLLYGEEYGKLRACRAQYAPYAEVYHVIEVNHPEAGPVLGVIMLPKPGMSIDTIITRIREG